jgi:hypothetical protein
MIVAIIVISYIIAGVALVDQLRRPAARWVVADRNRSWWVSATVGFGLLACGIFIGLAYLVGVVPAFGRDDQLDDAFRKRL